ncbi:MAG: hypothetical protein MJ252_18950, partial [archaeon]|nr:hypothetical protein [archaeon]
QSYKGKTNKINKRSRIRRLDYENPKEGMPNPVITGGKPYREKSYNTCPEGTKDADTKCKDSISISKEGADETGKVYNIESHISKTYFPGSIANARSIFFAVMSSKSYDYITFTSDNFKGYFFEWKDNVMSTLDIPIYDLGQCIKKLKEPPSTITNVFANIYYYNYSADNPTDQTSFILFDQDGKFINPEPCVGMYIQYTVPVVPDLEAVIFAKEMKEKNDFDVFDPNDKGFKEECYSLVYNDKDTIKYIRKKYFYKQSFICPTECKRLSLDYNNYLATCECPISQIFFKNFIPLKHETDSLQKEFDSTNTWALVCFDYLGGKKTKNNFLFIFALISGLTQIAMLIVYYYKHYNKVLFKLAEKLSLSPPKKKKGQLSQNHMNAVGTGGTKSIHVYQSSFSKGEADELKSSSGGSASNRILDQEMKDNTALGDKMGKISEKGIDQESDEGKEPQPTDKAKEEKQKEFDASDYESFEYDEAIMNDRRPFKQMFWDVLKEKEIEFSLFTEQTIFYPLEFRVLLQLYIINTFVFFGGFFCTSDYILDKFEAEGEFNGESLFWSGLKNAVIATVVVLILSKTLSLLVYGKEANKIIREEEESENLDGLIARLIDSVKLKIKLGAIIIIICNIGYVYFLLIFGNLYGEMQVDCLLLIIISVCFKVVLYTLICLLIACLRMAGINFKS